MDIPKSCHSTIRGGFKLIHQQEGGKEDHNYMGISFITALGSLHCTVRIFTAEQLTRTFEVLVNSIISINHKRDKSCCEYM